MCARYTYNKDEAKLRLREKIVVFGAIPHQDIRPTDLAPIIVPEFEGFAACEMRWGWHVSWSKQPLINAKSETLESLPTFKPHLGNRCLIPADGFFEKGIRFFQPGEVVFVMAGLWQPDGSERRFAMLTTSANESVAPYHDRMPFILRPEQCEEWLGDGWHSVLGNPDKAPLQKIQKQPELF